MAGKKVRYEPDHDGIARWALSNDVGDVMYDFALGGIEFARRISPRSDKTKDTHYQDSFRAEHATHKAGYENEPRAGATIVNDSDHARDVEARTNVLARTATALDGRQRWWGMDKKERASAKRRNTYRRKRASSK